MNFKKILEVQKWLAVDRPIAALPPASHCLSVNLCRLDCVRIHTDKLMPAQHVACLGDAISAQADHRVREPCHPIRVQAPSYGCTLDAT